MILEASILVVQVCLVLVVALRVAQWLVPDRGQQLDRALVGVVAALVDIVATLQLLGALHLLSRGWVLVGHGVIALIVVTRLAVDEVEPTAPRPRTVRAVVTALLGLTMASFAVVLGLHGRSLESDTVQYHAPNAGTWLRTHQLWDLPFAVPGYFTNAYPSNLELSALWWMLPLGNDRLAYLPNVLWGTLLVLAASVIARELGRRAWRGALAGLLVLAAPIVWFTHVNSLVADVAAGAGVLAACALVLIGRRSETPTRWHVFAGLALGLALGAKYTAFLPGLAVIGFVALQSPAGLRLRRSALVAVPSGLLVGFWLVRNTLATGNPVFPLEVAVRGRVLLTGGETPYDVFSTSMLRHLINLESDPIRTWYEQARHLLGPLSIVVLAGLLWLVVRGRRDRHTGTIVALTFVAGVSAIGYLATPYTGGGDQGLLILIASQIRYAVPAIAIGTVVAAVVLPRWCFLLGAAAALTYDAVQLRRGPGFRSDIQLDRGVVIPSVLLAVGVAVAWLGWSLLRSRSPSRSMSSESVILIGASVIAGVGVCFALSSAPKYEIDGLVSAAHRSGRVVIVDIDSSAVRALAGSNFENEIVKVPAPGAAGEQVPSNPADVNAAIARIRPLFVAVGPPGLSRPPGWTPPNEWRHVATLGTTELYQPTES